LIVHGCRRLSSLKKPDVVVQIVVLAEDKKIQGLLKEQGFTIRTCSEIAPIQVQPTSLNGIMKRLDQGHLHSKLEITGLTCPCRESNLGATVGGEHYRKERF
jgi:hypothetical protein